MNIIKKFLIFAFVLIAVLFVGMYIYLEQNGKELLERKLSAALKRRVHVREAQVLFPPGVRFNDIVIEGALEAKSMRFRLAIPLFFGHQFNIARVRLIEPVFYITRKTDKDIVWGKVIENPPSEESSASKTAPVVPQEPVAHKVINEGILINYFEVENGTVKFVNNLDGSQIDIGSIQLKALALSYPFEDINTRFDFSAVVESTNVPFSGRRFEAEGWINVFARNMDATARVVDADGGEGLSAQVKSVHNDMKVKGKVNIGRLISQIRTKDSKESSLEGFVVNALQSSGLDIGVNFSFDTKMDDFRFDDKTFIGTVQQYDKKPSGIANSLKENIERLKPDILEPVTTNAEVVAPVKPSPAP